MLVAGADMLEVTADSPSEEPAETAEPAEPAETAETAEPVVPVTQSDEAPSD